MQYFRTLLLLLAMTFGACTQVEFNDQILENPYGSFQFHYTWKETHVPDTNMQVFLSRDINTEHYYLELDPEGREVKSSQPKGGHFEDNRFIVSPGQYTAISVSMLKAGQSISGKDRFATDKALHIKDLELSTKALTDSEANALFEQQGYEHFNWKTLNTYGIMLSPLASDIYASTADFIKVGSNTTVPVEFMPQNIVQHLSFPFSIKVEEGITIEKVIVKLAGIPNKVNIANRSSRPDSLYCMAVTPQLTGKETDNGYNRFSYRVDTRVLGLYPPQDEWKQLGPGIAHFIVYIRHRVNHQPETEKRKIIYALRNMYRPLAKAKPMEYDEDIKAYRISAPRVELDTDYSFVITLKQLAETNNGGIVDWDDIESDIEGEL